MLKNRTISSILRYCKTKPRFLDIITKTALFQNCTNQGRVIPRPYCTYFCWLSKEKRKYNDIKPMGFFHQIDLNLFGENQTPI